jgi:hypothetical protein
MGVMTMKTISNTNITSTMGVTLMFELTLAPSFLTAIAIILLRGSSRYSVFKVSACILNSPALTMKTLQAAHLQD